jgi:AbrB family looped-hinge helix DNA binding protein
MVPEHTFDKMQNEPSADAIFYGDATVNPKGQMNLAAEARRDLGLDEGGRVLVFGRDGHVIVTPVPLADDLLNLALGNAAAGKGMGELDT